MKDNLLFVNARGLQIIYNLVVIALLFVTRGWRSGHWYFDAVSMFEPSNKTCTRPNESGEKI